MRLGLSERSTTVRRLRACLSGPVADPYLIPQ
jgi:hypothetical protein